MSLGKYINLLKGLEQPNDVLATAQIYFMLELMKLQGGESSPLMDHLIDLATIDGDSEAVRDLNAAKLSAKKSGASRVDLGSVSGSVIINPEQDTAYELVMAGNTTISISDGDPAPDGVRSLKFFVKQPSDLSGNSNVAWSLGINGHNIAFPNHDSFNATDSSQANEMDIIAVEWAHGQWNVYKLAANVQVD